MAPPSDQSLPDDLLAEVLGNLDAPSLAQAVLVCRRWRFVAQRLPLSRLILPAEKLHAIQEHGLWEAFRAFVARRGPLEYCEVHEGDERLRVDLRPVLAALAAGHVIELQLAPGPRPGRSNLPSVPQELGSLTSLQTLELCTEHWAGTGIRQQCRLPGEQLAALSSLTCLETLRCTAVSGPIPPVALSCLQRLTYLSLARAGLTAPPVPALDSRHLAPCTALRVLRLWDIPLALTSEDALAAWQHLERLACLRGPFGRSGSGAELATWRALPQLPRLTALCLSDHRGGEHAEALVEAVGGCRRLQELRLRGFGGAGLPPLAPTLTALRLVECGVPAFPGAPENEAPTNPQILDLEISEPGIFPAWPPGGAPLLARLQRLAIWGLRSAELPAHVAALTGLTSLALLDGELQTLPDGPFLALLQRLRLARNRLPRVPLALERATRLTFLDLSHNAGLSLRPAGLRVLQGLPALRQLQACGYQGPHSELEPGGVPWEALRDDLPGVSVASSCDVGCPLHPPLDI